MYTQEYLRRQCKDAEVFQRGLGLYKNQAILNMEVEVDEYDERIFIDALVSGSRGSEYTVWMRYNENTDEIEDYGCDCPAYATYIGMCKHIVAVALAFADMESARTETQNKKEALVRGFGRQSSSSSELMEIIANISNERRVQAQKANGLIRLEPQLEDGGKYYYGSSRWKLSFRIGSDRMYVLKDLWGFLDSIKEERMVRYGKNLAFVHRKSAFTQEAWEYIQMIEKEKLGIFNGCGEKEIDVSPALMTRLFQKNFGRRIAYKGEDLECKSIEILQENPPVQIAISPYGDDGFLLQIPPLDYLGGVENVFIRIQDRVYGCDPQYSKKMGPLLHLGRENNVAKLVVSSRDMGVFCGTLLPILEQYGALDCGALSLDAYRPKEAQISFYLDEDQNRVTCKVKSAYGKHVYNLLDTECEVQDYRDVVREDVALQMARGYFTGEDRKLQELYFPADASDELYHLLDTGISQLQEEGELYVSEALKSHKIIRNPRAQVGVALHGGLLELRTQSEDFPMEELEGLLEQYRQNKKYYRMKNGDFLHMEKNSLSALSELMDGLGIKKKQLKNEVLEVPKYRAYYIDQVLRENKGQLQVNRNTEYKKAVRDMKNVEDSDFEVPKSLVHILRGYQKTGYRWLSTLAQLGFGGILADDMGLGKTIQVIAYLLAQPKECGRALIVCPASLIYNWAYEIERFAPELSVRIITGTAIQRQELITAVGEERVWITSYDLLRRDIEEYQKLEFSVEIIDEAQYIKNQTTKIAKAVKLIHSRTRFALTGTPIENRLSELWSIFDYLMPGILGGYERFRKEYEIPIVQDKNEIITGRLRKMIAPFILRRIKKDVLKELPDKLEQVVYSEMELEQRKIYAARVELLLESLESKSSDEVNSSKIEILAELTRLRQICCAPQLLYENYSSGAAKVDTCMELVRDALSGNHKVLIFSQFTSMFPILEERLTQQGISFYELTGSTPKERRAQMVASFNLDETPVFLISLKAGGTGLNLTAASVVIHFDPWWNLAAQNQATDRAHRIGQKNRLVVFKLIAKNTIEEKILRLQEEKQELADRIFAGESVSTAKMSKEDFLEILR